MHAEDARIARSLRELRRREAYTQLELAAAASVPVKVLRRIERTGSVGVSVPVLRAAFSPLAARIQVRVWKNGAALDRLLDESHAAVVERVVSLFNRRGWQVRPEASFSEYGERGSIDVLSLHAGLAACAVCEIKADWGSMEETLRRLDVKARA